ncbi:MAG: histidine kinase dimerization/phospho-acceptor domain-containing protein, partial [bacterium]|nr:histidine kinase dimerization/phospho-acceptor domain-containing protein [bacterium]
MDVYNILLFATSILNFILGVLIFSRSAKKAVNLSYAGVCFFVGLWAFVLAMFRYTSDLKQALWWMKFSYMAATGLACSLLYFVLHFPNGKKLKWNKKIFIFIPAIAIFFFLFAPTFLTKDVIVQPWGKDVILGNWEKIIFALYFVTFFFGSTVIIWYKHKYASGVMRVQLLYILLGLSVPGTFGIFFNLVLPFIGNHKLIWLGPPFSVFMVAMIAYAIVVHRLMDIKLVMRKYSVYLSSLSVIILAAIGIKYVFDRYLALYTDWADFFILLAAISVFLPIKNYFYHLANRYFFSSLYDARQVIVSLSDKLRSTLEVEKIYQFISDTLTNAFHVKALGILNYDEKNQSFGILYNRGFNTFGQTVFPNDPELFKLFLAPGESVIVEELKQTHYEKHRFIIDLLMKLKVEIITPLNLKDKTIGLIVLSAKESGDMYNEEDLQVLKAVGSQAAIAIENALLYEESRKFGIRLEKEVEKATRDLRKANAQLKKLDQAKSDFISIASHQLRTPLTVIKGYISMMLEGNFGELTEPEKDSLEKIYESNERLINLVENLLNISRIESGRLQFDFKQVDLAKMAASVVEELAGNAKKKNLILEYQPPAKPLPKLKLDEEKIRQVVMNLVDNA